MPIHRGSLRAVVLSLLLAALPLSAALPPPEPDPEDITRLVPQDCVPHPAIDVGADEGPFGLLLARAPDGSPIYRPGSGITRGNGTPTDPFVIERLCLASADEATPHVRIANTTLPLVLDSLRSIDTIERPRLQIASSSHIAIRNVSDLSLDAADVTAIELADLVDVEAEMERVNDLRASRMRAPARLELDDAHGVLVEDSQARVEIFRGSDVVVARHLSTVDLDRVDRYVIDGGLGLVELTRSGNGTVSGFQGSVLSLSDVQHTLLENVTVLSGDIDIRGAEDVVLRDSLVDARGALSAFACGIDLAGSTSAIENVVVRGVYCGLRLDDGGYNVIRGNVFETQRGIEMEASTENVIDDNTLPHNGIVFDEKTSAALAQQIGPNNTEDGAPLRYVRGARNTAIVGGEGRLILTHSVNVSVSEQTSRVFLAHSSQLDVSRSTGPIHALWTTTSRLHHNDHNGSGSIVLEASRSNTVDRNRVFAVGVECTAIRVYGSPFVIIQNNTIDGCERGLLVELSEQVAIRFNSVSNASLYGLETTVGMSGTHAHLNNFMHNAAGVAVRGSTVEIQRNNFWSNGLAVHSSGNANARDNWWGCPTGPNTAGCDAATPTVTLVSPWRAFYVPGAGVN